MSQASLTDFWYSVNVDTMPVPGAAPRPPATPAPTDFSSSRLGLGRPGTRRPLFFQKVEEFALGVPAPGPPSAPGWCSAAAARV